MVSWPLMWVQRGETGRKTFDLDVRFSTDYVRFSPKSGRVDTVTVESANDPNRTFICVCDLRHRCPKIRVISTTGGKK